MRMMRAWRQCFHFQASEFLSSLFMLECHVYDLIEDFFFIGGGGGEGEWREVVIGYPSCCSLLQNKHPVGEEIRGGAAEEA